MSFQVGDVVRCEAVYGPVNTGRVSALPREGDPFYRVEVGEVPDGEGGTDAGCYFMALGHELKLVNQLRR